VLEDGWAPSIIFHIEILKGEEGFFYSGTRGGAFLFHALQFAPRSVDKAIYLPAGHNGFHPSVKASREMCGSLQECFDACGLMLMPSEHNLRESVGWNWP